MSQSRASQNQIYSCTKAQNCFCFVFSQLSFSVLERGNTETGMSLDTVRSHFTYGLLTVFYSQIHPHSACFQSLIDTTSSEPNVMRLEFHTSCSGKWFLQGKVLRGTIVLHYQGSVLRNILCLAFSKHQQSDLSPTHLQKNSQRPGLHDLASLFWVCKYRRLVVETNTSPYSWFSSS